MRAHTPPPDNHTPAGWYPQPDGTQRYWDGTSWTQHVADAPPLSAPAKKGMPGWAVGCLIAAGVLALIVGTFAVLAMKFTSDTNEVYKEFNARHTIVYEVTGDGPTADVTYGADEAGTMVTERGVTLPWTKTVTISGFGYGEITCNVTVDGTAKEPATEYGPGATAKCGVIKYWSDPTPTP